jgi:hypothetical protein
MGKSRARRYQRLGEKETRHGGLLRAPCHRTPIAAVQTFPLPGLDPGPRFLCLKARRKAAGPRIKSGETKVRPAAEAVVDAPPMRHPVLDTGLGSLCAKAETEDAEPRVKHRAMV